MNPQVAEWFERARSRPWGNFDAEAAAVEMASYLPPDKREGLACYGWPVFPCRPDKKPATRHGYKDASNDPQKVAELWEGHPAPLIGLPTGTASSLVVIDLDYRPDEGKNGLQEWAEIEKRHEPIQTHAVRTPSGGRHLYFRHPGPALYIKSTRERVAPGIDVRADGGYVIAPPSRSAAGAYETIDQTDPAELPAWLLALLDHRPADADEDDLPGPDVPLSKEPRQEEEPTPTPESLYTEYTEASGNRRGEGPQRTQWAQCTQCTEKEPDTHLTPEQVIRKTLPTAGGQRNRRLLDLARGLKFNAGLADRPLAEIRPYVREWHRRALPMIKTKAFEETWREFVATWPRGRMPLGHMLAVLAHRARTAPPAAAEPEYYSDPARLMVRLCRELARSYQGAPFPLSSHDAFPAVGLPNHRQALDTLNMLVADGILELVEKGSPRKGGTHSGRANMYHWLPPLEDAL